MSSAFTFTTRWTVPADPAWCWEQMEALLDGGVTSWWPAVTVIRAPERLEAGNDLSLRVRSPLGYRLTVDLDLLEVVRPTLLLARGHGDLSGTGRIEVAPRSEVSVIRIDWDVSIQRRWMRALAPVLRPAFAWAHDAVMRQGERSLRARLPAKP